MLSFEEAGTKSQPNIDAFLNIQGAHWAGDSLQDLARKLGVQTPSGASPWLALLGRLGEDGWELVTHTAIPALSSDGQPDSNSEFFTFKRAR